MKLLKVSLTILIASFTSCNNEEPHPKPKSYLRIDLPKKEYYSVNSSTCPFAFDIPNYASWQKRFKNNNDCSKAVIFPQFKAEILCDYINVDNDISEISEVFRNKMYDHSFKSTAIIERSWFNDSNNVYGITYEVKGNTACNYGFFLTDSLNHVFVGQLLFQSKPNYDSLSPMIKFVIEDAENLVESFNWIN